jgi:hypothetical protein
VKHATDRAPDQLEDLLGEIRKLESLKERKRGVFCLKSVAWLHFHEDPAGLFADLRDDESFRRYSVNNLGERKLLLSDLAKSIVTANSKGEKS